MSDIDHQLITEYDASKQAGLYEFFSRNLAEIIKYRYAIYNFVGTNLSSRYRRSSIGFLWSLLNPLFTMLIMAVVFSSIYKMPFAQFSIYLFSGLLPWNLITSSLLGGALSIINAETYLKKIYVPKIIFPMITVAVEVVNFLLSLVSLFVVALIMGAKLGLSLILLPIALLLLTLFLFGLVLLGSTITVYFRDFSHILQIGLFGMFYLTPILYPVTLLSDRLIKIVKLNPFYYFITLFRSIIYEAAFPTGTEWLICAALAGLTMVFGLLVFRMKETDVVYRL